MKQLNMWWKKFPRSVRRPIVLTVGMFFILLAGATGWLPGPGGIPLFLIGITILASEYSWAARLRDFILNLIYRASRWLKQHKTLGLLLIALGMTLGGVFIAFLIIKF